MLVQRNHFVVMENVSAQALNPFFCLMLLDDDNANPTNNSNTQKKYVHSYIKPLT
jgi:hypothetical protein